MRTSPTKPGGLLLGIEGGGTRTVALLTDLEGRLIDRTEFGPGNLRLLSDGGLTALFSGVRERFPEAAAIGVAMPGARTEEDRSRILRVVESFWPGTPCRATHDLETALLAGDPGKARLRRASAARSGGKGNGLDGVSPYLGAHVLVLSGTGSCCYGLDQKGRSAKLGGWGHILGDKGSAFEIGLRGLKAVVYYLDRDGEWGRLGQSILHHLALNQPDDLINWVKDASKDQVAGIARLVFAAGRAGDSVARDILKGAAASLGKDAADCARKLAGPAAPVEFILAGGNFSHEPGFARAVKMEIRARRPGSVISPLRRETAWGAVEIAAQVAGRAQPPGEPPGMSLLTSAATVAGGGGFGETALPVATAPSPTEGRNPRSTNLDKLSPSDFARLMLTEEQTVAAALLAHMPALEKAMKLAAAALKSGGRLFYVGAGTSGRLGVLDASECPPTFRVSPDLVQGIMAGGQTALWSAVEGAEDDLKAGASAVQFRGVKKGDMVLGIAASGRTPFVWGALGAARRLGAKTGLLCFNPNLRFSKAIKPDAVIAVDLGPELLTGSTRLKAGTATKLVLNLLSTHAMVRLGKVRGNLMIDLNPSNVKLRDRAARIVRELAGVDLEEARRRLEKARWIVRDAL